MSFLINLGYKFSLPMDVYPDGGILLGSKIAKHTLEHRKISEVPYLASRYFDPQLYMASINAYECTKECINLSSYPWFGTKNVQKFESKEINQKQWKQNAGKTILDSWLGSPVTDQETIESAIKQCIDFQCALGCAAIILPSPLTYDYSTDYSTELLWLDLGLRYVRSAHVELPIYATLALSDGCLRYQDPNTNNLIPLILDSISAREVNGVYFLVEQGNERQDTRYIANTRTLESSLLITHQLTSICKLSVITNFFGPFGLVLESAGAQSWASDWYKSLLRFRLADVPKPQVAISMPSYWSYPLAADIHLESEFELLFRNGFGPRIVDLTPASEGLFTGVSRGARISQIVDWRYSRSNVAAAIEHYEESSINAETRHRKEFGKARLDLVELWLTNASALASEVAACLQEPRKTKLDHVPAWKTAFLNFRRTQSI